MADSIDAVKRALLNDLRARLGDHFSGPNQDPVQDITLIAPEVFDVKARAPQIVLTDFRSGSIGCMTLETPEEFERWLAAAQQVEAELAAARQLKQAQRRGAYRRQP